MEATIQETQRVVIVGGGISGLSAAWYLQKEASERGIDLEYIVLEKSSRWGGKVLTEEVDTGDRTAFVVEGGPDSFTTQKPWALQLAKEIGLEERLLGTNDEKRNVFVLNKGKPVVMPDGVLLIVPTKFTPFALSPLISPLGKLRMGLDLLIPAKDDDEDETLAQFIRRRLGNEALDKIAEPLMSGIYNADAEQQSILATFPRFRAIEKQYGSLTRGMIASRKKRPPTPQSGKKKSVFMTMQGGTNELIDALVPKLSGDLRLNTGVVTIENSAKNSYRLILDDGSELEADAVILATPAYISAEFIHEIAPDAAKRLEKIRYVSTGTISFGFKATDIPNLLDGVGVVIPTSENRPINAITISSTKFDHRAPDGTILLRAFFGGSRSPESMHLDDDVLLETVRTELDSILGIAAEPLFHRIYRWWNANPQYDLGHLELVDKIEAALPEGLYVTGSPYRGVGMPDCVHQSQQTVAAIMDTLKSGVQHG
ncbi:MAG: protoporphyrinogen oxidase [Anaerolineae bacterium]|nr:protoporphyrinogen oxidase [Anaerolineae bacterium]